MFDKLATPVAFALETIHKGVSTVLSPGSGPAWTLSIVLLVVLVRLILFPLFVKQIKSQRRMQEIAPMVKEIQKRHKGDRETMNTEMMKLYKEQGANPISGCLPLLVQIPVFFALFSVIRQFGVDKAPKFGLSSELLEQGGLARFLGAPIASAFNSTPNQLGALGGASLTNVRVVAALLVVAMGATTFWTQRQMIARTQTTDPQQLMVQRVMLYVLPFSFVISGALFPIGLLIYWTTTNLWSMGQQHYIIKRMPPVVAGGSAGTGGPAGVPAKPKGGGPGPKAGAKAAKHHEPHEVHGDAVAAGLAQSAATLTGNAVDTAPTARPNAGASPKKAAGTRKNKQRRGGRR